MATFATEAVAHNDSGPITNDGKEIVGMIGQR